MKTEQIVMAILVVFGVVIPLEAADQKMGQSHTGMLDTDVFNASYEQISRETVPSPNEQLQSLRPLAMVSDSPTAVINSFMMSHFRDAGTKVATLDPESAASKPEKISDAELAEMMLNPLGHLWILYVQHDITWLDGDLNDAAGTGKKTMHTTKFQPVMPLKLTEEWSLILRPVFQYHSVNGPFGYSVVDGTPDPEEPSIIPRFGRQDGLGDTILLANVSNQTKPPFIFGFGPTFMFPTASDDRLGAEKWAVGPSVLALYIGEKWVAGTVAQHWWSFAGESDRDNINLTDVQPIIRYRITPETNIGFAPNIQYNWDENQWTVPVGLGVATLIRLGDVPLNVGLEYYHYVEQDDAFGPQQGLRLGISTMVPSPGWAKKPLF